MKTRVGFDVIRGIQSSSSSTQNDNNDNNQHHQPPLDGFEVALPSSPKILYSGFIGEADDEEVLKNVVSTIDQRIVVATTNIEHIKKGLAWLEEAVETTWPNSKRHGKLFVNGFFFTNNTANISSTSVLFEDEETTLETNNAAFLALRRHHHRFRVLDGNSTYVSLSFESEFSRSDLIQSSRGVYAVVPLIDESDNEFDFEQQQQQQQQGDFDDHTSFSSSSSTMKTSTTNLFTYTALCLKFTGKNLFFSSSQLDGLRSFCHPDRLFASEVLFKTEKGKIVNQLHIPNIDENYRATSTKVTIIPQQQHQQQQEEGNNTLSTIEFEIPPLYSSFLRIGPTPNKKTRPFLGVFEDDIEKKISLVEANEDQNNKIFDGDHLYYSKFTSFYSSSSSSFHSSQQLCPLGLRVAFHIIIVDDADSSNSNIFFLNNNNNFIMNSFATLASTYSVGGDVDVYLHMFFDTYRKYHHQDILLQQQNHQIKKNLQFIFVPHKRRMMMTEKKKKEFDSFLLSIHARRVMENQVGLYDLFVNVVVNNDNDPRDQQQFDPFFIIGNYYCRFHLPVQQFQQQQNNHQKNQIQQHHHHYVLGYYHSSGEDYFISKNNNKNNNDIKRLMSSSLRHQQQEFGFTTYYNEQGLKEISSYRQEGGNTSSTKMIIPSLRRQKIHQENLVSGFLFSSETKNKKRFQQQQQQFWIITGSDIRYLLSSTSTNNKKHLRHHNVDEFIDFELRQVTKRVHKKTGKLIKTSLQVMKTTTTSSDDFDDDQPSSSSLSWRRMMFLDPTEPLIHLREETSTSSTQKTISLFDLQKLFLPPSENKILLVLTSPESLLLAKSFQDVSSSLFFAAVGSKKKPQLSSSLSISKVFPIKNSTGCPLLQESKTKC